jgi:hypothetical protein
VRVPLKIFWGHESGNWCVWHVETRRHLVVVVVWPVVPSLVRFRVSRHHKLRHLLTPTHVATSKPDMSKPDAPSDKLTLC